MITEAHGAAEPRQSMIDESGVTIRMSDGVDVSVRVYRPQGDGRHATLFAASPYRYDNDDVPHSMTFLWHEVGPIAWYVGRGYAYVHLDVRGSGRSGGEFGFFDRRERRDYYEVIEWIAAQPWSNGKVGGIGQSYYGASQWCMAAERPPHLTCIAPFDGHIDFYRGWFFAGGIQSNFIQIWWNDSVRAINRLPMNGAEPRFIEHDLLDQLSRHTEIDDFWDDRSIDAQLAEVDIPVYSIGIWIKRDLHLGGNVRGYRLVKGPKKLLISGAPTLAHTLAQFASVDFHERVLAPFYDHYLRGDDTDYPARPSVEYPITGAVRTETAETWPPPGTRAADLHLCAGPTGSVSSLNDGALSTAWAQGNEKTSYFYPDPQWAFGNMALTPAGPDPVARNVTFTSSPLTEDLLVVGAPVLTLFVSSTRNDANVIVKLSAQHARSEQERVDGIQPKSQIVAKGWLRASHRALDEAASIAGEPYHPHRVREPLEPGTVYELTIELTPMAHLFAAGTRIRLELSCADSAVTDGVFSHVFSPDMFGTDSFHHSERHPSRLSLPVLEGSLA